jgi:hypothetical protein
MTTSRLRQTRVQHPVGHGFFHYSTIRSEGQRFDYIVDCGGSPAPLLRQIRAFKQGRENRPLDLVVLSHFHADHVGGLSELLADVGAQAIAMPYLHPAEKLLVLARSVSESRDGADVDMILRPVEWAASKGAGSVYYVFGGTNAPPDPAERRDPREGDGVIHASFESLDAWRLEPSHPGPSSRRAHLLPHTAPLEVHEGNKALWSFRFFCYSDTRIAQAIEQSLAVESEWPAIRRVWEAIKLGRTEDILGSPRTRKHLRAWYEHISRRRLNLTSLCVLSAPAARLYHSAHRETRRGRPSGAGSYFDPWTQPGRVGWLGTGDALLKQANVATAFRAHYSQDDLDRVACMSLPHHGSKRNHNGDLLDVIDPWITFVTCPATSNGRHPSREVSNAVHARGDRLRKVTERESSMLCERIDVWLDHDS